MLEKLTHLRLSNQSNIYDHFNSFAKELINGSQLVVNEDLFRIIEVEFYLYNDSVKDVFTHCSEYQAQLGKWYFHRIGNSFKNGSFKGLDITFGGEGSYGGILIRSLQRNDGSVINGPSLVVDEILKSTNSSIKDLDDSLSDFCVNDIKSKLFIKAISNTLEDKLYHSPRVGLSLKKVSSSDYVSKNFRFLVKPKLVKKGRVHLIIALHKQDYTVGEINKLTASPVKTIEKYINFYTEGASMTLDSFDGIKLGSKEICHLHGFIKD